MEVKTINPPHMINNSEVAIATQAGEYLVWADENLKLHPMLATSWQKNRKGDIWDFKIRKGVLFHNGNEMTADDVIASFQRLVDEKSLSPAKSVFTFLKAEGITACGKYCVRFKLDRPLNDFPFMTQHQNAVILPKDYKGNFAVEEAGTGPFIIEKFNAQHQATLRRNPNYWQSDKPYLDKITFKIFKSSNALILALRTGAVDGIQEISYLNSRALKGVENINISTISSAAHIQMSFKNNIPPFDDPKVRKAIHMAINRKAIIHYFYGGHAKDTENHLVPDLYGHNLNFASQMDTAYDPFKARELLKDAGYPNGFEISLVTYTENGTSDIAVILKEMLADIGITMHIKIEPPNLYYSHWTDLPFTLSSWSSRNNPTEILNLVLASNSPWNLSAWHNQSFDETLKSYERAKTENKQNKKLQKLIEIQHDENPILILFFPNFLRASHNHIHGFRNHHASLLDLRECWREQ